MVVCEPVYLSLFGSDHAFSGQSRIPVSGLHFVHKIGQKIAVNAEMTESSVYRANQRY